MANAPRIEQLLRDAKAGDQAALGTLIGDVRERVFRWALVITRDPDDAEDVTQQVSLAVHRKVRDFEERSRFTTWLYAVVRNTAIELMRKPSRRHEIPFADDETPAPVAQRVEDQLQRLTDQRAAALVRAFFAALPNRQRELIELVDVEGYSAVEAAQLIGIQADTARVHLMRARRTIRLRMLESHPELFT
jgi:RNA polymerase sigma-70 factor (ECF subfamily)